MSKQWHAIESVNTDEGVLELRMRGDRDYLITIAGRVLMNSYINRSEILLSQLTCNRLGNKRNPRVLIGGLGMGYTLRAALDDLPYEAKVVVAELNPVVVKWCRGPIAHLTNASVNDPRVTVVIGDVAAIIRKAENEFDAIILDLYEGPFEAAKDRGKHLYGSDALRQSSSALVSGGVLAVWSEDSDKAFEKRLIQAGFTFQHQRPGRGTRHSVYISKRS